MITPRIPGSMPKPPGSHRPIHGSTTSILGPDTTISGSITATADLHIEGRIEGDISCMALVQSEGSEVIGAISAETVRISGQVNGSVSAREVVISRTARISGDIAYDALTIEQGAQLDGRLTPRTSQAQTITRGQDNHEARLVLAAPVQQPE